MMLQTLKNSHVLTKPTLQIVHKKIFLRGNMCRYQIPPCAANIGTKSVTLRHIGACWDVGPGNQRVPARFSF